MTPPPVPPESSAPQGHPPPESFCRPPAPPFTFAQPRLVSTRQPLDPRAIASLLLGLVSLVTGALSGIPAVLLGAQAMRDEDRLRLLYPHLPRRVAAISVVGMLSGTVGSLLFVAWVSGVAGYTYAQRQQRTAAASAYGLSGVTGVSGTRSPVTTTRAHPHAVSPVGTIHVVDLDEQDPISLRDRLRAEVKTARDAGQPLLVEIVAASSPTCDEIASEMGGEAMQRALAGTTIVRVDAEAFEDELRSAGMWQETVPWFYRIDSNAHPTDAVGADEWDENTSANMAKVLGPFARGNLDTRRHPSPLTTSL